MPETHEYNESHGSAGFSPHGSIESHPMYGRESSLTSTDIPKPETHDFVESHDWNGFSFQTITESHLSYGRESSGVEAENPETQGRRESQDLSDRMPHPEYESQDGLGRDSSNFDFLRYIYEQYKDIQAARIRVQNRERQFKELYANSGFPIDALEPVWNRYKVLQKEERTWLKTAKTALDTQQTWNEHLQYIRGVGPVIGCGLLGFVGDHNRFKGLRSLYHYAGYHVDNETGKAPKRRRGKKISWNPRLRTLLYQLSTCLMRTKNPKYYPLYLKWKAEEKEKNPEISKGHAHNRALRKMVKRFLKDLWSYWWEPETQINDESHGEAGFSLHDLYESQMTFGRELPTNNKEEITPHES